jgi:hypothetical protein
VISISNKASSAITQVTVATDWVDAPLAVGFAAQNGGSGGTANAGGPAVQVLSSANETSYEIPIGAAASVLGSIESGGTAGNTYTFTISSYIGAATTPYVETLSVTAQI